MSVINVIFNGVCINTMKSDTINVEDKDTLIKINYASTIFSGLIFIINGFLLYILKRSSDEGSILGDFATTPPGTSQYNKRFARQTYDSDS